jgi:2-polyprenyl-3-methyl-5-hydroxy-6-metoxy-1,4-benzoquinol methylase
MRDQDITTLPAASPPPPSELRFEFGRNWTRFLASVDDKRIDTAVASLRDMLQVENLAGREFLDIGCGSGMFSLAARRLGARVMSFDYDEQAVRCAMQLRERYLPGDNDWRIEQGSVLDEDYLASLGTFDVVYCWGMLHHTGSMWDALANVASLVKPSGYLFTSIYNDQGGTSRRWRWVKRSYNRLPSALRFLLVVPALFYIWTIPSIKDLLRRRPFATWRAYAKDRGMSPWWDLLDWVGGYPFEVARPSEIFQFYRERGFVLERMQTSPGPDCNEFVFRLPPARLAALTVVP